MTTSININPDVASLKKAFSDLRNEAQQTQDAIGKSLDTDAAVENLNRLQATAVSLKKALDGIGDKTKVDVDVKDADSALAGLQKRIDSLSGPKATVPRKTQAVSDEERLHTLRQSHINQEAKLKRRLTEQQARDADAAFKNFSRSHPHLRQFQSYGDFLSRGRERYGGDFDRISREVSGYVGRRSGIGFDHQHMRNQRLARIGGSIGGALGGLVGGGMGTGGTMGTIGSMAGSGIGAAAGLLPGALGLIGGPFVGMLAGSLLGGLGRQLDEAMGEAINESVKSGNLARSFNSGFGGIRDSSREAARGMQVTSAESAQYSVAYARAARMTGPGGLMESLRDAYGFGRDLGVGQGAGVSFLSSMRGSGAASDEKAAKRVGIAVAEAIQRGGLGPQADEVLSAVQNFAQTATSTALRAPNVGAFSDMLASGTSMNLPGLHAGTMASILQNADAAMRGGGAAGMAGQIVMNEAISSLDRRFDVFESGSVSQGGMFSTAGQTFGRNSALYAEAKARYERAQRDGDKEKAARAKGDMDRYDSLASGPNSGTTAFDAVMGRFEYMGTSERIASMAKFFNLSHDNAAALSASYNRAGGMGGVNARLSAAGIDSDKVNMSAVRSLVDMTGASDGDVRKMAGRLLDGKDFKKLDDAQERALRKAMTEGTEPMRDAVLRAFNAVGGPLSEGDRAQQIQVDMKNAVADIAKNLIPATNTIKDGILSLVEKLAPDTQFGHEQARRQRIDEGLRKRGINPSDEVKRRLFDLNQRIDAARNAGNSAEAAQLMRERNAFSIGLPRGGGRDKRPNAYQDQRSFLKDADPAVIESLISGKGTSRVYGMADGSVETRTGGTRAWRSNNPGNIEYGSFAKSHGAIGSDGRFAIFSSYEAGRKAKENLLFEGKNYRNLTLDQAAPADRHHAAERPALPCRQTRRRPARHPDHHPDRRRAGRPDHRRAADRSPAAARPA